MSFESDEEDVYEYSEDEDDGDEGVWLLGVANLPPPDRSFFLP